MRTGDQLQLDACETRPASFEGATAPERMSGHDEKPPRETGAEALIQMLGVYQVDLLAEVEGVLRSLSRMQQQVERLRTGFRNSPDPDAERREAVKVLAGNVRTMLTKLHTLGDTLPDVEKTIRALEHRLNEA